jgi:hypothetical protein
MPRGNSVDAAVSIEVWARKVRRDRDREERDDIYQTLSTLWWGVLEPDANPYTMAQREIEPHMWINPGSMLLTKMNPVSAFSRNGFNLKVELSRELDARALFAWLLTTPKWPGRAMIGLG